jgi:hypothetical protein
MKETLLMAAEFALMLVIGVGIAVYVWQSAGALAALDWGQSATFEEFVQRVLLLLIGLELILVIRVHSVRDLFLVAVLALFRKALDPSVDTSTVVMLLIVALTTVVSVNALARKGVVGLADPL